MVLVATLVSVQLAVRCRARAGSTRDALGLGVGHHNASACSENSWVKAVAIARMRGTRLRSWCITT
ncbi:hypothetical protein ENSA7_55940 [Enhygromyxa salina]|uniref:Uncharacterized protein n=1 Tax=Enhygromyxa salina TaxID=215803 RepID=A0A2S9YAF2_9BACT|nr:hypothetical protein ENSA7_55940 [Enhygromyxa salina]